MNQEQLKHLRRVAGPASAKLQEHGTQEILAELRRRKEKARNDLRSSLGIAKKARKKRKPKKH